MATQGPVKGLVLSGGGRGTNEFDIPPSTFSDPYLTRESEAFPVDNFGRVPHLQK